ncbi:histidine phosphatase family protein [Peribacillus sp. SCS-155]|uniref:histidine phosphatase family protein n=1 Tax=Peribacillus sedimenti TaxID=3115297 RepID=UPI003906B560
MDWRFRERDLAARDHYFNNPNEAMQYVFEHPDFKYPGGESNQEVQERGIRALRDVISKYQGKRVAIGIHGNIMTCTLHCSILTENLISTFGKGQQSRIFIN